jgi:uncharacterized protein YhfF
LIRTTRIEEREFQSVEDFALAEGEGSYEGWKISLIECWKDKKDHNSVAFGNGVGKIALCNRFDTIRWGKSFPENSVRGRS